MSVFFVKPQEIKYELVYQEPGGGAHPFWIKVKKFLTVGEERRVMTAGWRGIRSGEGNEIRIDWKIQTFARTEAYLTDWSFTDDKDAKIPTSRESLEALSPEVYALIENAITEHVVAVSQEKKVQSGNAGPSATSG